MKTLMIAFLRTFPFLLFFNCTSKKEVKINNKKEVTLTRTQKIQNHKQYVDSINQSLNWKKTNYDLWKSNKGDLAIKVTEGTAEGIFIDRYIDKLSCEKKIKDVVDTLTFKYIGSSFYKDKNNVYTHFDMASGGIFFIVEKADPSTFKILGNCYAKDKNYIFGERAMLMKNIDYKTFKTSKEVGCFAKDKNGYYFWDSKINIEEETDEEVLKKIELLKKI